MALLPLTTRLFALRCAGGSSRRDILTTMRSKDALTIRILTEVKRSLSTLRTPTLCSETNIQFDNRPCQLKNSQSIEVQSEMKRTLSTLRRQPLLPSTNVLSIVQTRLGSRFSLRRNPKTEKKNFKFLGTGNKKKPRMSVMTESEDPEIQDEASAEARTRLVLDAALTDADSGASFGTLADDDVVALTPIVSRLLAAVNDQEELVQFLREKQNARVKRLLEFPLDGVLGVVDLLLAAGLRGAALLSVLGHDHFRALSRGAGRIAGNLEGLRQRSWLGEDLAKLVKTQPQVLVDFEAGDWDARQEWFAYNFAARHFNLLLPTQPRIFYDPLEEIIEKFNYVFFNMGLDQKQMLECYLFNHSAFRIKSRHEFLKRCGVYRFPDPRRRVLNTNPHLSKILDSADWKFVSLVPGADVKDFMIFRKIVQAEEDDEVEEEEEEEDGEEDGEEPKKDWRRRRGKGFFLPRMKRRG